MIGAKTPAPNLPTLGVAIYAAVVSTAALGWQVWVWWHKIRAERLAVAVDADIGVYNLSGGTGDALRISVTNQSAAPVTVKSVGGQWQGDRAFGGVHQPWEVTPSDPAEALPRVLPAGEVCHFYLARSERFTDNSDPLARSTLRRRKDDVFRNLSDGEVRFWAQLESGRRFWSDLKRFTRGVDKLE